MICNEAKMSVMNIESCRRGTLSPAPQPPPLDLYMVVKDWETSSASSESSMSNTSLSQQGTDADRLVNRLKNTNAEKFVTMVKMHLSFLLDLPGSSLEDFLGDNQQATPTEKQAKASLFSNFGKRKPTKESKQMVGEPGVFGVPLTAEVIENVYPLLDFLNKPQSLREEGLFRKSGHIGRQRILREKLQTGDDLELDSPTSEFTAHDCASVLKMFLGELSEPLLIEKHYMAYCQIPAMVNHAKQLATVQLLLQLLPKENFMLLECVMELLHKVAYEESNKMTADTLGTVFAPTILAPKKMIPKDLQAVSTNITSSVAFMIENAMEMSKVPEALVLDIKSYWDEMDEVNAKPTLVRPGSAQSLDDVDCCRTRFRKRLIQPDSAITTAVSFADRQASQQAAASTDTETALAQLYAHISTMPESAKKRKLLKQFNKANGGIATPRPSSSSDKHKRSKSLGESIKKMVGRSNHKRRGSGHAAHVQSLALSQQQLTPCQFASPSAAIIKRPPPSSPCRTPVHRLFTDRIKQQNLCNGKPSSALAASPLSSPRVHIVDMKSNSSNTKSSTMSSTSGKRKAPGVDSPMLSAAATQTSLTMLANFINNSQNNSCDSCTSDSLENQENKSTSKMRHSVCIQADKENGLPKTFQSPLPVKSLPLYSKVSSPRTPEGQFVRHCSLVTSGACGVSPITQSVTKAPKSVQQSVATPGSRQPMALVQTP